MLTPSWQQHHSEIIQNTDDAIISKDLNGVVQTWNAAAERIFGYAPAEMIGQPITKIIPPERLDEEPAILAKIRKGERVDHFQTVRQRKDGRHIDVSVTISPIRDADGTIVGVSKIARDITAMKRTEHERARLFSLGKLMGVEYSGDVIAQAITNVATELSGAQFGAFFYNETGATGESYKLYTLAGAPREAFEKFPMPRNTELFAPTFTGQGVIRSDDITKDPRYGRSEPFRGMPKGHLPVRSYLAVPVFSRSREVIGGLFFGHADAGVFDERSESVVSAIAGHAGIALENARLHREVKENMERFQQLANMIPQLAWMARPDGHVFWYNRRWYEYTGTTPESQKGWGWESVHDPRALPRVVEKWKEALSSGNPWEDTFPLRRHDGEFRQFLSRALPMRDESGKIVIWFGTNTDVTEQEELIREREEILRAERAARAESDRINRMKDEFLATLSHELRTPLNAILGWCQIINRSGLDAPTVHEGLEVIERNARAQTQLIEELLDMSRIISGKVRLDVQRVDLAQVVNAALETAKPAAESRDIRIQAILDPHAGPVMGDPMRLQQVIWNLLSNAIKFTPKKGSITVALNRIDSHVGLSVSDTGEGIEPQFLPHVFDRFSQADSSTTRRHGGQVQAHSAGKGLGTTFSFTIPVAVTRDDDRRTRSRSDVPGVNTISLDGIHVLVVEDEADAREVLRRLLAEHRADVWVAASADEAMDLLRQHQPDAIISDIGMPQKDGYHFIRDVRQLPPEMGGRVPAIALTAFARSEDRTRAIMAGYQSHLAKPVDRQELIATVASMTGRAGAAG